MVGFAVFCAGHPALLHSLFFLMGLGFIKNFEGTFLIPFFILLIPLAWKKPYKVLSFVLCFVFACFYGHSMREIPPSQMITKGICHFIPSEIKEERSHFKKTKLLKGTIKRMGSIQNIPCSIALLSSAKRPFILKTAVKDGF